MSVPYHYSPDTNRPGRILWALHEPVWSSPISAATRRALDMDNVAYERVDHANAGNLIVECATTYYGATDPEQLARDLKVHVIEAKALIRAVLAALTAARDPTATGYQIRAAYDAAYWKGMSAY